MGPGTQDIGIYYFLHYVGLLLATKLLKLNVLPSNRPSAVQLSGILFYFALIVVASNSCSCIFHFNGALGALGPVLPALRPQNTKCMPMCPSFPCRYVWLFDIMFISQMLLQLCLVYVVTFHISRFSVVYSRQLLYMI